MTNLYQNVRHWIGADEATSHYLNQWWLVRGHIYASLGLNKLTHEGLSIMTTIFQTISLDDDCGILIQISACLSINYMNQNKNCYIDYGEDKGLNFNRKNEQRGSFLLTCSLQSDKKISRHGKLDRDSTYSYPVTNSRGVFYYYTVNIL